MTIYTAKVSYRVESFLPYSEISFEGATREEAIQKAIDQMEVVGEVDNAHCDITEKEES